MQTFCSIPNIFLLRAQDSSSRNQSLPHPHLRVLATTVWFWHCLCELILHRLRLLKFPRLWLNLCKAPMFTQCPVFPFFPVTLLPVSGVTTAGSSCHAEGPPWTSLNKGVERLWLWLTRGWVGAAREGWWEGFPGDPQAVKPWPFRQQSFEGAHSQPPGAAELRRKSRGQVWKPQSPSFDTSQSLLRTHWVIAGVWWITKLDLIPVIPALAAMKSLPKTMSQNLVHFFFLGFL